MRDRTPLVIILATILAVLGIKSMPSGSSVPRPTSRSAKEHPPAAKEARAPTDVTPPAGREFWQPLVSFVDTGDAWQHYAAGKHPWPGFPHVQGWKMHCLIALIPDPRESNVGYRFDSLVDALQRAVETQDYVLDRHFFPWTQATTPVEHGPPATSEAKSSALPIYERQPGVLLFRDGCRKRLLLVFLVGETATAGIHKRAFTASLQFMASVSRPCEPILLLGPSYSGSQNPLEQAITQWARNCKCKRDPPPQFRIISGTATAINRSNFCKGCKGAKVTFHATVIPEHVKFQRLLDYLRLFQDEKQSDQWLTRPVKVACLYESSTGFGKKFMKKVTKKFMNKVTEVKDQYNKGKKQNDELIFFPFPLHISETRNAYLAGSDAARNTWQLPALGGKIHIPFDTSPDVRETEPTLDPAMTAVTSERILATMLSTLARERYRYVVIAATDVRDQIFLATLVRQFCGEIHLLFTSNDMLLSHPDYSPDLKGSLIASTYPLCPMNQHWSFPFQKQQKRLFFPSEAEYGYYNAAIALLNCPNSKGLQHLLEYGPPLKGLTEQDRGRPPVWISIIGQNGPQPLEVYSATHQEEDKEYVFTVEGVDSIEHPVFLPQPDAIWIAARLAVTVFVAFVLWAFAFVLWRHRQGVTAEDEYHSGLVGLLWPRSADLRHAQRAYVWRCFLAVLVLFAYLALVCNVPAACRLFGSDFVKFSWTGWLMPLVTVLLLAAFPGLVLWKMLGSFRTQLPSPPSRTSWQFVCSLSLIHWVSLLLLAVALIYLLIHLRMMEIGESVQRNLFFYERATNLAGGVSPVVPVVFLGWAFFAWSFCQLKRLYLLDRHFIAIPFPGNETTGPFGRIHARHVLLDRFLRDPHQVGATRASVLIWLLLLFVPYRFADSYVPTVEGVWYDTFLFLGLALFCLVLVYALMQVFRLWRSIHELLQAIAPLPLTGVFNRIPPNVTRLFGPYLTTERPGRETHLPLRREQQNRLQQQYGDVRGRLQTALGNDPEAMAALDANFGHQPRPPRPGGPPDLGAAQACLTVLDRLWVRLPVNVTFGGPTSFTENSASPAPPSPPSAPDGVDAPLCGWLALAEEFVAVEVVAYLSQFFVQLRNLLVFLTISPLFLFIAATSYPFHPQRLWMMFAGALILAAVVIAITIFIQVERDEVVSRISGTRPNKLNFRWDFLANVCTFALPLLGVLVATSTNLTDLIHAWLDPLLQLGR
jgi:hypothetical protein